MKPRILLFVLTSIAALSGCGSESESESQGAPVPSGYDDLCQRGDVACQTAELPPNLVGTYQGEGTTISSTNETWDVGYTETFVVEITQQSEGRVTGAAEMESFRLDVEQADVRGDALSFTIYGRDSFEHDGCTFEARGVIAGAASDGANPSTLEGELLLSFTENIAGPGCTQEQIANYPGTGAVFEYSATRSP